MLPSRDIVATRDFFHKVLKFSIVMDAEEYCVVAMADYEIHIQKASGEISQMSSAWMSCQSALRSTVATVTGVPRSLYFKQRDWPFAG